MGALHPLPNGVAAKSSADHLGNRKPRRSLLSGVEAVEPHSPASEELQTEAFQGTLCLRCDANDVTRFDTWFHHLLASRYRDGCRGGK